MCHYTNVSLHKCVIGVSVCTCVRGTLYIYVALVGHNVSLNKCVTNKCVTKQMWTKVSLNKCVTNKYVPGVSVCTCVRGTLYIYVALVGHNVLLNKCVTNKCVTNKCVSGVSVCTCVRGTLYIYVALVGHNVSLNKCVTKQMCHQQICHWCICVYMCERDSIYICSTCRS